MQKNTTYVTKTDSISDDTQVKNSIEFGPKSSTIANILQFAASYQAEKISDNQFVGLILN
jgi:hypothetical protein